MSSSRGFILLMPFLVLPLSIRASNINQHSDNHNDGSFDYKNTTGWPKKFPTCGGSNQSPINFKNDTKTDNVYKLVFDNYDVIPKKMTIQNNGHSVQLSAQWLNEKVPKITVKICTRKSEYPLKSAYVFEQLHFHWGPNNSVGSEHTINNKRYTLELHLVHWLNSYDNFTEASKHSDGLVVLGYMYSIGSNRSEAIERITEGLQNIKTPNTKSNIQSFRLSDFEKNLEKEKFYYYKGSLTTPPCSESVTWLVSPTIKNVDENQMLKFRKLQLHHQDTHNYREIQNLNSRQVFLLLP